MKEGEGISQRTYMKDPWTGTMVQGLTIKRVVLGRRGWRGASWDNCNSVNNKKQLRIKLSYDLATTLLGNYLKNLNTYY